MRELIEQRANEVLVYLLSERPAHLRQILDLDLGYWNEDNGPDLTDDFLEKLIEDLEDDELLELYDCVNAY